MLIASVAQVLIDEAGSSIVGVLGIFFLVVLIMAIGGIGVALLQWVWLEIDKQFKRLNPAHGRNPATNRKGDL